MTHTTVNDRAVAGLPRLDDHGRAVLFTQAQLAGHIEADYRPGERK